MCKSVFLLADASVYLYTNTLYFRTCLRNIFSYENSVNVKFEIALRNTYDFIPIFHTSS
jgi:hypothetical protein